MGDEADGGGCEPEEGDEDEKGLVGFVEFGVHGNSFFYLKVEMVGMGFGVGVLVEKFLEGEVPIVFLALVPMGVVDVGELLEEGF